MSGSGLMYNKDKLNSKDNPIKMPKVSNQQFTKMINKRPTMHGNFSVIGPQCVHGIRYSAETRLQTKSYTPAKG